MRPLFYSGPVPRAAQSQASHVRDVRLEQADLADWARAAGDQWADSARLLDHLLTNSYHVDAARQLDWGALCREGGTALDLGCGSGWLTALLTQEPTIDRVIAWDSSPTLIRDVLPATVERMGGDLSRIERVCGSFTPLLLDDASVDLVAMSSAFHHCEDADALLTEIRRVLRPGGRVVLANETPWGRVLMTGFVVKLLLAAVRPPDTGRKGGFVATDHVLYDEDLGDRARTRSQWRRLAERNGFELRFVDSGLPSFKPSFRPRKRLESNLVHLILEPVPGAGS